MTNRPPQSQLAPHTATLLQWRKEGKSWGEMADLLRKEHGLDVARGTIHSFLMDRQKGGGDHENTPQPPPQATSPDPLETLLKEQQRLTGAVKEMGNQIEAMQGEVRTMAQERRETSASLESATRRGWIWLGMGLMVLVDLAGSWKDAAGFALAALILIGMGWWTWRDRKHKANKVPINHAP